MLVHDTWAARDLPVLDATVGLLEQSYMVTVTDIAARTGLDPSVVAQALEALDPIYVDFRKTTTGGDPRFWYVFKVTPEARRAVGQWPTAEALAGRLADELATAARQEVNGERQALLSYAARLVGDTLREATVRAAGAVLAPAFGGIPQPEKGQPMPPPEPPHELEFGGLVPLPELPELLRPDRSGRPDQTHRSNGTAGTAAAAQPEPTATPESEGRAERKPDSGPQPAGVVSDLNPWPERSDVAAPRATAQELEPLPKATPFPSSLAPVLRATSAPGAGPDVEDPDSDDTDLDLVQSRGDTASAI